MSYYSGFKQEYVSEFFKRADQVCAKYLDMQERGFEIGEHMVCPIPARAILEVMEIWVRNVDKLIDLVSSNRGEKYSEQFIGLYQQRGITYGEYYYLFDDALEEEEYPEFPVFIFTKTYTKHLKRKRFKSFEYTENSYKEFVLSFDIVPSHYFKKRLPARFCLEEVLAHSYCVAKTRSGKTEFLKLVVYNLIKEKDPATSLLVLDPHGEFARELRRLKILEEKIDDFIYVDPTLDPDHTPVFNPFEVKDRSTVSLAYSSDTILDAFEQLLRDQAITGNMRRLLRHCIYALLYHDGTTMMDLLTLLQGINRNRSQKNPEFLPMEEKLMKMGKSVPDPLTSGFFEYGWKDVDSRTISAVIERIDGILSHPIVRRFMIGQNGESSFDLKSYLNSGKIVVVNLDFTRLGNIGSEAIGRLIVSEAQNISAQRNRFPREQRPKTIIFMDECQRFVSAAIERALSEFGKFNTFLFLAHQYIEQIDDGMVKAMLSNTENKIIGRNSAASMGAISSDVGVEKEELMQIKKYEFYLKSGDKDPFKFASSDLLLDKPGSPYYNTEEEARERIDTHMIRHYYRPIETHNREYNPHDLESSENGQNGKDASQNLAIQIDEDDF